ncbi:MAG: hypothetical protein V4692_02625 [Bdellovibrionota bacterium]
MTSKRSAPAVEILINAKNVADVLALSASLPKNSYAEIARRAGFASRNFPREIACGHRKVSAKSIPKLCRALGFKGDSAKYFTLLASLENPQIDSDLRSRDEIKESLTKLRGRLTRSPLSRKDVADTSIYLIEEWPTIYAALGTFEHGASLDDIILRSGFGEAKCEKILVAMESRSLVRKDGDRFYAINGHLIFSEKIDKGAFKKYFAKGLKKLETAAEDSFNADDKLFFQSSFSVSTARMPELKKELRELILKFVDESEQSDGDRVSTLLCGLF